MGNWKFEDYQSAKQQQALSIQLHIKDMLFGAPKPFPPALRQEVARCAPVLANVFDELGAVLRLRRHLVAGQRLDPRKRRDIGAALRRGDVDSGALRPYLRRDSQPEMPHISIVASAGVDEVNGNLTYIGRITQLTLAAAWACEIVGAPVTACLMESVNGLHPAQPYREALLGYTLVQPGRITPLQAYNVALQRDTFYSGGFRLAYIADKAAQQMAAKLVGVPQMGWGGAFISSNGGNAVHWTRTLHQADIVIAFGNITDAAQADIRLGTKFKVVEAVQAIAEQARKLVTGNMRTV